MLRRRRPWGGRQRFFLTARPIPQRIAGYNPAPPVEIGRVPTPQIEEPPVPTPAFPPDNPVYWPDDFFGPPPPYFPPTHIPPGPLPCLLDDDDDPDTQCEPPEPEEPPTDVPEPGILILLVTGALTWRLFQQRMRLA
ncbi:MAG: hypothetical protein GXP04_10710 [Alphaproteobacteria bacterium]|nr:hypothetical protein [Alphaproteobacteria bacterium]